MNIMLAGIIGGWEIILILAMILLLFGSKKLPELARGLGQGIKEFKKATNEVTSEIHNAMEETPPAQKKLPPATTVTASEVEHSVPQSSPGQKA